MLGYVRKMLGSKVKVGNAFKKELLKSDGRYFDCAFLEYYPEIKHKNHLPSSFLLLKALKFLPFEENPILYVKLIRKYKSINRTLFSIRNEQGRFSMEYYFGYHKVYPENSLQNLQPLFMEFSPFAHQEIKIEHDYQLISINPHKKKIKGFNYYYTLIDEKLPITTINGFQVNTVSPLFYTDFYDFETKEIFKSNLYHIGSDTPIIERIHNLCSELYPNEDSKLSDEIFNLPFAEIFNSPSKQDDFHCSIKNDSVIGLYMYRLNISNFLEFLCAHSYPKKYISEIERNKKYLDHLKFDVVVDFYLKDNQLHIKKTGFGGTF